jgi:hypothetical protein
MASDRESKEPLTLEEQRRIEQALVRLNERGWGIAFALLGGLGLFAATLILVLRGGETVGPHLALLGIYLPGYEVTTLGAVIGLAYGAGIGYIVGYLIGALYNRLVRIG